MPRCATDLSFLTAAGPPALASQRHPVRPTESPGLFPLPWLGPTAKTPRDFLGGTATVNL